MGRGVSIAAASLWLLVACGDDSGGGDGDTGEPVADAGPTPGAQPMDGGPTATATGDAGVADSGDAGAMPTGPVAPGGPCEPVGECDPWEDGGVCDDGACQLTGSALRCGAVAPGAGGEGDPCEELADCRAGTTCLTLPGGPQCVRLCQLGTVGGCGEGASCSGTTSMDCLGHCRALPVPCDVLAQDCVGDDEACSLALNRETDERYTGCVPAGAGALDEACENIGDCGRGLVCIGSACRQVCDPEGGEPTCPGGRRCNRRSTSWDVPYCN